MPEILCIEWLVNKHKDKDFILHMFDVLLPFLQMESCIE